MQPPQPRDLLRQPVLLFAFGFGSGLSPRAPGTVGTLAALPLVALSLGLSPLAYVGVTLAISLLGIPLCGEAARRLGVHDHGGIVWDEFAGLFVTAAPLLWLAAPPWLGLGLAFAWFRLFDIAKPWPIRWLDQQVDGGLGIMLDDLVAGLFGAGALWLSLLLL